MLAYEDPAADPGEPVPVAFADGRTELVPELVLAAMLAEQRRHALPRISRPKP